VKRLVIPMFRLPSSDLGRVTVVQQTPIEQTRLRMGTRTLFSGEQIKLSNRRAGVGAVPGKNLEMYENSGQPVVPGPKSLDNTQVQYRDYMSKKMRDFAALYPDPTQRMQFIAENWRVLKTQVGADAEI